MERQQAAQLDTEVRQYHLQRFSKNRYVVIILLVSLGLAASIFLFRLTRNSEQLQQQAEFTLKAKDLTNAIQHALEHKLYENDTVSSLYAASLSVERDEFHEFVKHMLAFDPTSPMLAWLPRVVNSNRARFEEKTRQEGYPNFTITEKNAQGKLVRAGQRSEYFPIDFLEPYEGNEPVMGFDIASDASLFEALTRARDTGESAATSQVALVSNAAELQRVLIFTPIFKNGVPSNTVQQRRKNLQGFVLGAYRIGVLIENAVSRLAPSRINILFVDTTAPHDKRALYFYSSPLRRSPPPSATDETALQEGLHFAETLPIAGREWLILCSPEPGTFTERTSPLSWALLAFGLIITGFFSSYLWLIFSRVNTSRRYAVDLLRIKEGLEHEIVEHEQADLRLRAIKEQLAILFNNSPVSLWLEDVTDVMIFLDALRKNGHADLRTYFAEHPEAISHAASLLKIVDVNQATLELYGAQNKEDLLVGLEKTFTTESYQAFSEGLIAIAEGYTKFAIETAGKTLRNEKRNVVIKWSLVPKAGQQPSNMVVSVLDITERKLAETAIQKHESQLIESQRIARIGSWERDIAANRVTGSDELYRLFDLGPPATPLSYQHILDRVHPDDRERFMKSGKEAVYENKAYSIDFRIIRGDGIEAIIHSRGEVIHNEKGKPVLFRGTVQDITESKKLEEQLLQAHKMEAVGQLAGGIAHDFNNILTAIIGYGSIMKMKMMPDDPLIKHLDGILASSQRAATLTQNLLAFSRKQVIQKHSVDMNKIVRNIEELLSRIIGEDVELKTTLAPGDVKVLADPGQIEQVLMNLATNARDAMPLGGVLSIGTSCVAIDSEVSGTPDSVPAGNYAVLSLSDTGEGLDHRTKQRMFDPFFTTKEVNKGTGLGLSIVHGIVKQHSGFIAVVSVLGAGTTFKIYLPLSTSANEETRTYDLPVSHGGNETILYAEDNADIREMLDTVLTSAGYRVIAAHDGEDAIQKFIEDRDRVDLLVLDVIMPKKSGKEAYDEIRKIRSDIKVLFVSGYTVDMIAKRGVMEENENLLYKPVTPDVLLKKVRTVLQK